MKSANLLSDNSLHFPVIWARTGYGYRIESLEAKNFPLVVNLLKNFYINQEILHKSVNFSEDLHSIESFLEHVNEIVEKRTSIALIDERSETVVGVLLLSVVNKIDFGRVFSHLTLDGSKRKAYNEIINLKVELLKKVDFYADYNAESVLRFYLLCIHDQHRGQRLGVQMLQSGMEFARILNIPIATATFSQKKLQKLAASIGFNAIHSISYANWTDWHGDVVFKQLPPLETEIVLMVAFVPPPYVPNIVYEDHHAKAKGKGHKKDKQKKDKKKKKKFR